MNVRLYIKKLSDNRAALMGIATLMVMIHHITWKSSTGVVSYIYMFVRHLGAGGGGHIPFFEWIWVTLFIQKK